MSGEGNGGQYGNDAAGNSEQIHQENERLIRENLELRGHVATLTKLLTTYLEGAPLLGNGLLRRDVITDEQ